MFLYAAYRLQFLELLDGGEQHKAFTQLTKRLKPLESCAPSPAEFRDLCYLLTCSVNGVYSHLGVVAAPQLHLQLLVDVPAQQCPPPSDWPRLNSQLHISTYLISDGGSHSPSTEG